MPRRDKAKPLKRSSERRPERRTIVAFTEGSKSEPDYIKALKALPHIAKNVALSIEIYPEHGVPYTLVRKASDRKSDNEIDECWCIFDVEAPTEKRHPNLKEALTLAQKNDISLAISNPCFELWLILHHKIYSKWCTTDEAESHSRSLDGRPGKSIVAADNYMPLRKIASERAEILDVRHAKNDTLFPENNPSSGMHLFLRALGGEEQADER